MSGLEQLKQALDEGQALGPIEAKDTAFPSEGLSDESALKLVLQDTDVAEKYLNSKALPNEWDVCDQLVRAYVAKQPWSGGSNASRANLSMPVVLEAIETLLPQAHMAFFSDPQPFLIEPKGKTSTGAARAMGHVACWAIEETGFQEEIRKMLKGAFTYGIAVGKYGWARRKHTEKKYSQEGTAVKSTPTVREVFCPTFEYVPLPNLLVDPHCKTHDIQQARFVEQQFFLDATELDDLREQYDNVPTRTEFAVILAEQAEATKNSLQASQQLTFRENQAELPTNPASADPLKQKLEILEYWTDDRVITVLQRKIVLRNEKNEFGKKPFRSCAFIDVLNSFYGFGVSKLLEGEQRFQTGVVNKWIDSLDLRMNPMFHRKKGMGQTSQNIQSSPGRVVNDDGDLVPLEVPDFTQEALTAIGSSESRASRRVGSNSGPEMPTQALRTAEGVQAFTSGVQVKLQYFVENFANLVFVPVIEAFLDICKDNMTPDEINAILTDKDGKEWQGDILDLYNGKYSIAVLSSVKLAARRAMVQMILPITQMLGQPAIVQSFQTQAKKFNWVGFFEQIYDVIGYPGDNLVDDMTDQDKQMLMMQNPAIVKAQTDQQKTAVDHQNALELTDKKGDVQGSLAVVKSALKHGEMAAKPESKGAETK